MHGKRSLCPLSQSLNSRLTKQSTPAYSPLFMPLCFVFCSSYQSLAKFPHKDNVSYIGRKRALSMAVRQWQAQSLRENLSGQSRGQTKSKRADSYT